MKEVVLDTETTGISVKEGHRIVEIGCIELENLIPTKNKFHCYLNPERKVSEKALEVHGYTDEFLATQKKFIDIGEQFLEFIKDILVYVQSKKLDILKNLKKRKNFNKKLLKKFKEIQLPLNYKKKKSHFIIKNNFTKKSIKDGIKNILKEIK